MLGSVIFRNRQDSTTRKRCFSHRSINWIGQKWSLNSLPNSDREAKSRIYLQHTKLCSRETFRRRCAPRVKESERDFRMPFCLQFWGRPCFAPALLPVSADSVKRKRP